MSLLADHTSRLRSLGISDEQAKTFQEMWSSLEREGYELYAMYSGNKGTAFEGKAACTICSSSAEGLEWREVITPSMDSAAIYFACRNCRDQYVDAALKQKALGRLLKERNTRPN